MNPLVPARLAALTVATMVAFAANSVLCRIALKETGIDAASFTTIRLVSGALVLWLIAAALRRGRAGRGNWLSALALFAYAAAFSFAYLSLTAATGALLLFGAVQATMILYGYVHGERFGRQQLAGLALALGGLVGLLLPGLTAPPPLGSALMLAAGIAWGVYSLRGRGAGDPTRVTAGVGYAVASGAIASGMGYALWYAVLPALRATTAATVQLSVPALAAFGGIVFLGEPPTLRLALASAAILGGIALVILYRAQRR